MCDFEYSNLYCYRQHHFLHIVFDICFVNTCFGSWFVSNLCVTAALSLFPWSMVLLCWISISSFVLIDLFCEYGNLTYFPINFNLLLFTNSFLDWCICSQSSLNYLKISKYTSEFVQPICDLCLLYINQVFLSV